MDKKENTLSRYKEIRQRTVDLISPLEIEDCVIQPADFISPPKWHLGHTTWFFEKILLSQLEERFTPFDEKYFDIFNSYYKTLGNHWIQGQRGHLSRPTVKQVLEYRRNVDHRMIDCLSLLDFSQTEDEFIKTLEIGLQHEQQHQELLLTDIKFILSLQPESSPFSPKVFHEDLAVSTENDWLSFDEDLHCLGHDGKEFSYDNEQPQFKYFQPAFSLKSSPVTNGEYIEFIEAGGYQDSRYWHSAGFDWVQEGNSLPLYWRKSEKDYYRFSLQGETKVDRNEILSHISFFEAAAFARWKGQRLPTEFELEIAMIRKPELFGRVWEWSESAYSPYPGFNPFGGALQEYNEKFMVNQKVLRGGSIASPKNHIRPTYRNFFYPHQRWQFTGIRLAKDNA